MANKQKFCKACGSAVWAIQEKNGCFVNLGHILMTICTGGFWILLWIFQESSMPHRCPRCGGKCK